MEYIVKGNGNDNFGMAVTLELQWTKDQGIGYTNCTRYSDCPRLGCCPKGGRAVPPWDL